MPVPRPPLRQANPVDWSGALVHKSLADSLKPFEPLGNVGSIWESRSPSHSSYLGKASAAKIPVQRR